MGSGFLVVTLFGYGGSEAAEDSGDFLGQGEESFESIRVDVADVQRDVELGSYFCTGGFCN